MEHIKLLDFFGVFFHFRMENYESFTSKTGGIYFIIYIFVCLIIAFQYIAEFFDSNDPKNYVNSHQEVLSLEETINLVDENFTFGIQYPDGRLYDDGPFLNDVLNITVVYKTSNSFDASGKRVYQETNIRRKNCSMNEFYTDKFTNYSFKNMECFDFESNQTINGYFFSKNFSFFQLTVDLILKPEHASNLAQSLYKNQISVDLMYPKNVVGNYNEVTKIMSDIYYLFNTDYQIYSNIYIKKKTFIQNDGILNDNSGQLVIGDYERHETFSLFQNFKEKISAKTNKTERLTIGKFYFRQFSTSTVREKIRNKFVSLISKINALFINVFIIFRIFMTVVNLKKAKKHILENVFYINTQKESENKKKYKFKLELNKTFEDNKSPVIQRIDHKSSFFVDNENIKQKLFVNGESIFLEFNKKQMDELDDSKQRFGKEIKLEVDNFNSKYEGELEDKHTSREMKESFFVNVNVENNKNADKSDENLQDEIKNQNKGIKLPSSNMREKGSIMFSMIKDNFSNENKLDHRINIRSMIIMCICCKFQRLKKINRIYSYAEEKFDEFLNIKNYIKKIQEMESLKSILFNEDTQTLFDFVSRPRFSMLYNNNDDIISTDKKNNIPKLSCLSYQKNLYGKFIEIYNKPSKSDLEKKLLEVFFEKLN